MRLIKFVVYYATLWNSKHWTVEAFSVLTTAYLASYNCYWNLATVYVPNSSWLHSDCLAFNILIFRVLPREINNQRLIKHVTPLIEMPKKLLIMIHVLVFCWNWAHWFQIFWWNYSVFKKWLFYINLHLIDLNIHPTLQDTVILIGILK